MNNPAELMTERDAPTPGAAPQARRNAPPGTGGAADAGPEGVVRAARSRASAAVPWLGFALGTAAMIGAFFVDQRVTDWLTSEPVASAVETPFALIMASAIFANLIAILSCYANRGRLIVGFVVPLLLSTAITHVVKFVIGRARPLADEGPFGFDALAFDGRFQSFPSGHSTAAVTLALLMGIYFPRARWVFYFFALGVAFERILHDRHYLSDVIAGALVGAASVFLSLRLLGARYYDTAAAKEPVGTS